MNFCFMELSSWQTGENLPDGNRSDRNEGCDFAVCSEFNGPERLIKNDDERTVIRTACSRSRSRGVARDARGSGSRRGPSTLRPRTELCACYRGWMRYEVGSQIETCERLGVERLASPRRWGTRTAGRQNSAVGNRAVRQRRTEHRLEFDDNITVDAVGPAGAQTVQVLLNNVVATTVANRPTSSVTSIVVQGGNLSDLIDLSRVGSANYPNLQGIHVDAGHGGDTILGSNGIDETLLGNHGEDLITCQIGNSTVLVVTGTTRSLEAVETTT